MPTLGERIRTIRKQKKMTLDALAGKELTKGMLSLIENNKANPSMESLNYIAKQLDVNVSELLEEVSQEELREVLEKVELLLNTSFDALKDEYSQAIELISPYIPNLTNGYEAARLLDIYSRCLYLEKKTEWEEYWERAADMYEKLNITNRRAKLGILKVDQYFSKHNYESALSALLKERKQLESTGIWIDHLSILDYNYLEATLYFALGNYTKAIEVMEQAINYSTSNKIFYRLDDLYRLASVYSIMVHDEEQANYYLEKLRAYFTFTEDKEADSFVTIAKIHQLNFYKQEYEKTYALFLDLKKKKWEENLTKISIPFYLLEHGITLYGMGRFDEAIDQLKKVSIPEFIHHPIDLSLFYRLDAYLAVSYDAIGKHQEAIKHAKAAVQNIADMPDTPYKQFINDTYLNLLNK